MGMVLVTHDLGIVAETCDRVIVMYCGQIVEEATTLDLFAAPCHPYTAGLIACIPKLTDDKDMLEHIPGQVMPITQFGQPGCRFAARCPHVADACRTHTPPLFEVSPGHTCRCWRLETGTVVHE